MKRVCRWYYDPQYNYARRIPFLRNVHGFVLDKPKRIHKYLLAEGVVGKGEFRSPPVLSLEVLRDVHSEDVVLGLQDKSYIAQTTEFPLLAFAPYSWVKNLIVMPQLRAASGTIMALEDASRGAWAFNLSGGYHHACPDYTHGFCLLNDVALAVHALREKGIQSKILVLDLDLHQGDANALAFEGDASVYTVSMHQESAFPHPKMKSDLDIGLPDGVRDDEYIEALDACLEQIESQCSPDIIVYLAGTDISAMDRIGSFELSEAGILRRDERVAQYAHRLGVGLVGLTAGGYSLRSPVLAARGFARLGTFHSSNP